MHEAAAKAPAAFKKPLREENVMLDTLLKASATP
jgi:hypothetical protein